MLLLLVATPALAGNIVLLSPAEKAYLDGFQKISSNFWGSPKTATAIEVLLAPSATSHIAAPLASRAGSMVAKKGLARAAGSLMPGVGTALTVYMGWEMIQDIAKDRADLYPKLHAAAMSGIQGKPYVDMPVGTKVADLCGQWYITRGAPTGLTTGWYTYGQNGNTCFPNDAGLCSVTGAYVYCNSSNPGVTMDGWKQWVNLEPITAPPLEERPLNEFQDIVAPISSGGNVAPTYDEELANMFKDNPSQVTAPNAGTAVADLQAEMQKAAEAAKTAESDALKDAAENAWNNYSTNKTPENYQRWKEAEAAKSGDEAEKLEDASKTPDEQVEMPGFDMPELKKINYEKFRDLIGILATHWPFTLLTDLHDLYNQFVIAEPSAPVFDVYFPGGNTLHIDLAIFNPLAQVCRAILSTLLVIGAIYFAVKRFTT